MTGIFNVHNHILPEVDDGADDIKEALQMLELEYQDGVRTIIVTPHYRKGMFECSSERILKKYPLSFQDGSRIKRDDLLLAADRAM